MDIVSNFHAMLRRSRSDITALLAKKGELVAARDRMRAELADLADKPQFRRRYMDVSRNEQTLTRAISEMESCTILHAFESQMVPFSKEFMRRYETVAMQPRQPTEAYDPLPSLPRVVKPAVPGQLGIHGYHVPAPAASSTSASSASSTSAKRRRVDHTEDGTGTGTDENLIATIGNKHEEHDPAVVLDEMAVALDVQEAKLYMNPRDVCDKCNVSMEIAVSHPMLVCPLCHDTKVYVDVTSASMGFGKSVEFNRQSNNERIATFQKTMAEVQMRKVVRFPAATYTAVMAELARNGVKRAADIRVEDVFYIVKAVLKLSPCYHSVAQIYHVITNTGPQRFSPEQAQMLLVMFLCLQEPFQEALRQHAFANNRRNFITYDMCFNKEVELLGLWHWLPYFPQLHVDKNEEIWKFICNYNDWEYVPSVAPRLPTYAPPPPPT